MNAGLALAFLFAATQVSAVEAGGAPPGVEADTPVRSVVIADMVGGPRYRADLQVVPPPGSSKYEQGAFGMFNLVYEADFRVRRVLSGPSIGQDIKVLFIGNHLDAWRDVRMLIAVGRNELGQPWADRNWLKVTGQICLDSQAIQSLNVHAAFNQTESSSDGMRCIPS